MSVQIIPFTGGGEPLGLMVELQGQGVSRTRAGGDSHELCRQEYQVKIKVEYKTIE